MAIWQFDIQLIPNSVIKLGSDYVNSAFVRDGLDTSVWWRKHKPQSDYRKTISQQFTKIDSWSPEILLYGNEEDILVEVVMNLENVEGIGIRIDVRHVLPDSLSNMMSLIKHLECHIFITESGKVIAPDLKSFLPEIVRSKAGEFVADPDGFLQRLRHNNAI